LKKELEICSNFYICPKKKPIPIGMFTYIFINNIYVVETTGFLAVFAEALLGAPQFYRNFINKSTQGMR
jgi:hypothetical protein